MNGSEKSIIEYLLFWILVCVMLMSVLNGVALIELVQILGKLR